MLRHWARGNGQVLPLITRIALVNGKEKALPGSPQEEKAWTAGGKDWQSSQLEFSPEPGVIKIRVGFRVRGVLDLDSVTFGSNTLTR